MWQLGLRAVARYKYVYQYSNIVLIDIVIPVYHLCKWLYKINHIMLDHGSFLDETV